MKSKIFHNGKRDFHDAHGRRIYLERLVVEYSYLGVLLGEPDRINARRLEQLPRTLSRLLTPGTPYVLLRPTIRPGEPLPTFLAIAEFGSAAVQTTHACSALAVAWYLDDIRRPMSEHIADVLKVVDWNSNARDYDS